MNNGDQKEKQRETYNDEFDRNVRENIAANRFVVAILSPSIESCMHFYIYLN